eukprot:Pgem_evm1s125
MLKVNNNKEPCGVSLNPSEASFYPDDDEGNYQDFKKNLYAQTTRTSILAHDANHFRPDGRTQYFLPFDNRSLLMNDNNNNNKNNNKHYDNYEKERENNTVAVVVPFYNEQKCDLKRTLEKLHDQEQECLIAGKEYGMHGLNFHYLAVMDGYYKASDSMKEYVTELYGPGWDAGFNLGDTDDCTLALQKQNLMTGMLDMVEIKPGKFLRLTIVVKKQNRKKPNSHEWFFRAFCP